MASSSTKLEDLKFENLSLKQLPVEEETQNFVRQVPNACFSRIKPTKVTNPTLVAVSKSALELLDLDESQVKRDEFVEYFAGNKILPGSETAAHCYCGHQFGYFSGQLGDGAAIYLGEIRNREGQKWEIQLKGAGKTPYSRTADGRKVLRSTIREFLCSEAMHFLGIPTSRAGCCITSDTKVIRDIFYTGNPIEEKCTIVLRIAPSFLRFGSFEIFKPMDEKTGRKGPSEGRNDIKETLLNFVIENYYKEIWDENKDSKSTMYKEFYREVVRLTARLVVKWQCVGWCHGVLNTDNMSIVGITIDYGPFGFMDSFDSGFICNGSDDGGRYAYNKQPEICRWNCQKLAEVLDPFLSKEDADRILEDTFQSEFDSYYLSTMRNKFGLFKEDANDSDLVQSFLDTMQKTGADFTNCFRKLSHLPLPNSSNFEEKQKELLEYLLSQSSNLEELKLAAKPKMDPRKFQTILMLMQMQPDLVNQLLRGEDELEREIERYEIQKQLKEKTEEQQQNENLNNWKEWLKLYTERLTKEIDMELGAESAHIKRKQVMDSNNPKFVLRNYLAQNAIDAAEKGDYSEVQRVLELLEHPFDDFIDDHATSQKDSLEDKKTSAGESKCTVEQDNASAVGCQSYQDKPPIWARSLKVT